MREFDGLEETALLLKTLGHPVRLKIVTGLATQQCACVKEIWECLGLPQAVVSQHLKVMKESGILTARREGNKVCYAVNGELLAGVARLLLPPAVPARPFSG